MNGWQPIESAPKKENILTCSADGRIAVAIWFFGGWASSEPCLGDPLNEPPTHWMPLPEPPHE